MFIPQIYDDTHIPAQKEFNAVKVVVDGSLKADLEWDAEMELASQAIKKGLKIFWEIDLGLFSRLPQHLSDEGQARTLKISLDHFQKQIWERFSENSLGLAVYRGSADFVLGFPWKLFDDYPSNPAEMMRKPESYHKLNLFCRDVCIDLLDHITEDVPDAIPLFVLLDAQGLINSAEQAEILSKERFKHYHLVVKGSPLPPQWLAWDSPNTQFGYLAKKTYPIKHQEHANVAVVLPPMSQRLQVAELQTALDDMSKRGIHFRIIPEPYLTMEWEELDYLLFIPECLSDSGERKLQGFCAAGGTAVTLGKKIGLPLELSYQEWMEKLLEIL